ncbi:MAG TPA: protein phosphatase CheZ [Stellaceae bacterium]|nr:protein phosphatase CheZ [Stellaceae bacterium]
MTKLLRLSEDEYSVIEDALAANARGRAFLRMRDQRARAIAAEEVKRLMRSLVASVKGTAPEKYSPTHIHILRQELQEMSVYIQQTRAEIAALRPDDSGNNRIMAATGELDAIVTATERATSDILNAAERIAALTQRLPKTDEIAPIREELEAQATEILTACSFQDITGQRTTKVVNTLRYLEKRVNSMIEIWGIDSLKTVSEDVDTRPDAHLLNGPSLEGVSQDDVDALLAELNGLASPDKPEDQRGDAAPPVLATTKTSPSMAAPTAVSPPPGQAPTRMAPLNGAAANGAAINQNDIDALFE